MKFLEGHKQLKHTQKETEQLNDERKWRNRTVIQILPQRKAQAQISSVGNYTKYLKINYYQSFTCSSKKKKNRIEGNAFQLILWDQYYHNSKTIQKHHKNKAIDQ